jgi:hypothetical protein
MRLQRKVKNLAVVWGCFQTRVYLTFGTAEIQALLSKDGVVTKFLQKAAENRWSCAQLEVEMKVESRWL